MGTERGNTKKVFVCIYYEQCFVLSCSLLLLLLLPGSETWPFIQGSGNHERQPTSLLLGSGGSGGGMVPSFHPLPPFFPRCGWRRAGGTFNPLSGCSDPAGLGARRSWAGAEPEGVPGAVWLPCPPCPCLEIYRRRRWVPGESAVPRRGGGSDRGPSPGLFWAIYACSGINTIDKSM